MNIRVYVEGQSDRAALERLLGPLATTASHPRPTLKFFPLNGKAAVLEDAPIKAARDLKVDPDSWHIALPDLHPVSSSREDAHQTPEQLKKLLRNRFLAKARELKLPLALHHRFRAHCLKYDLEALLLAVPERLRDRLGMKQAPRGKWKLPVEDQNDKAPPKSVVKALFQKFGRDYLEVTDAPQLLRYEDLSSIERACPQCFQPFVQELRIIVAGGNPDAPSKVARAAKPRRRAG